MSYPSGMMAPVRNTGTKHRGLGSRRTAPHKLTPMLGVLADEALDQPLWLVLGQLLGLSEPWRSVKRDHETHPGRIRCWPRSGD